MIPTKKLCSFQEGELPPKSTINIGLKPATKQRQEAGETSKEILSSRCTLGHRQNMAMEVDDPFVFEDYFPSMIERLGSEGFMGELCNGFCLLMDVSMGLITFESLKRNTLLLGLHDLRDDELVCMLAEGDLDGDGALNQMEFFILMFRLSPGLMDGSKRWMEEMGVINDGYLI